MRYFIRNSTLFIRGIFRAVRPAIHNGTGQVSTLLIRSVPAKTVPALPEKEELEHAAAASGYFRDFAGFTTVHPINSLCIFQYDFITAFITAGTGRERDGSRAQAVPDVSVIVVSAQGLSDAALPQAAGTARQAAADSLAVAGRAGSEAPGVPVIVASEGEILHNAAGPESAAGSRIRAALLYGVPVALQRAQGPAAERPAFFIFSRFRGEHWVEWVPENCPYYPCHFEGQRCDFCYCPLYPCGDEELGEWAEGSNGGRVWNCARCTMVHEPAVADYLHEHPEASKDELVRIWKKTRK